VTSSRFPIGVAQTARGTILSRLALAVERIEGDERGPDEARALAQLGLDDPEPRVGGPDRLTPRSGARAAPRFVVASYQVEKLLTDCIILSFQESFLLNAKLAEPVQFYR